MTWTSTAKMVLLCLALVILAGAETVWSLAVSKAPAPECERLASGARAERGDHAPPALRDSPLAIRDVRR
jgi:hypothetical protein